MARKKVDRRSKVPPKPGYALPVSQGADFEQGVWLWRHRWLAEVPHLRQCLGEFEQRLNKLEAQVPPSSGIPVTAHDAAWAFWKSADKVRAFANRLGVDVVVSARKS